MQFLSGNWLDEFNNLLHDLQQESDTEFVLISPFISPTYASLIISPLQKQCISCKIITRLKEPDFVKGASSCETLIKLVEAGAKLKALKGLHAKVYLFGSTKAVITSGNFTKRGLGKK